MDDILHPVTACDASYALFNQFLDGQNYSSQWNNHKNALRDTIYGREVKIKFIMLENNTVNSEPWAAIPAKLAMFIQKKLLCTKLSYHWYPKVVDLPFLPLLPSN